jgi:alkaline phosphatase
MVPDGATAQDFIDLAVEYWGSYWSNMTLDQAQTILDFGGDSYAASQYISSELTAYGWTTHGHTGEDVPVWTYGCRDPQMVDNTDLAKVAAKELRVSLKLANKWLFVDVQDVFDNTVLESADEGAIMKIGDNVVLHEGKDYLTIDGVKQSISGLSVYAPELETFFVPRDAIFKIRRSSIPRWR